VGVGRIVVNFGSIDVNVGAGGALRLIGRGLVGGWLRLVGGWLRLVGRWLRLVGRWLWLVGGWLRLVGGWLLLVGGVLRLVSGVLRLVGGGLRLVDGVGGVVAYFIKVGVDVGAGGVVLRAMGGVGVVADFIVINVGGGGVIVLGAVGGVRVIAYFIDLGVDVVVVCVVDGVRFVGTKVREMLTYRVDEGLWAAVVRVRVRVVFVMTGLAGLGRESFVVAINLGLMLLHVNLDVLGIVVMRRVVRVVMLDKGLQRIVGVVVVVRASEIRAVLNGGFFFDMNVRVGGVVVTFPLVLVKS
jgi:hypothetical protein